MKRNNNHNIRSLRQKSDYFKQKTKMNQSIELN